MQEKFQEMLIGRIGIQNEAKIKRASLVRLS